MNIVPPTLLRLAVLQSFCPERSGGAGLQRVSLYTKTVNMNNEL